MRTRFNFSDTTETMLIGGKFLIPSNVPNWKRTANYIGSHCACGSIRRRTLLARNLSWSTNKILKGLIDGSDLKDKQKNEYVKARWLNYVPC